jgi:ribonuclease E
MQAAVRELLAELPASAPVEPAVRGSKSAPEPTASLVAVSSSRSAAGASTAPGTLAGHGAARPPWLGVAAAGGVAVLGLATWLAWPKSHPTTPPVPAAEALPATTPSVSAAPGIASEPVPPAQPSAVPISVNDLPEVTPAAPAEHPRVPAAPAAPVPPKPPVVSAPPKRPTAPVAHPDPFSARR